MGFSFTDFLKAAPDIGRVASGIGAGRAQGRVQEAGLNISAGDENRRRRASALADALRGRMLQSTQDANISNLPFGVKPPTITGGSRPSNIVGAGDLGRTLAAQGDAELAKPDQPIVGAPNALDKTLGAVGQGTSLLGSIGKIAGLGKTAAAVGSGVASGITGGAGAAGFTIPGTTVAGLGAAPAVPGAAVGGGGSTIGGFLTNPLTAGIGGGIALALAVKHHQNAAKGDREKYAKSKGFKNLAAFNEYLSTLGPEGQALRTLGESRIGKHDEAGSARWAQQAEELIRKHVATLVDPHTGQFRK